VILIAVYGLCFAAALWWMRGAAARAHASKNDGDAPPAAGDSRSAPTREQLLSGAGLDPRARPEYARRLATDCCDCGCDLTLHDCLVGDQKCVRSAQIAQKIWSGSK